MDAPVQEHRSRLQLLREHLERGGAVLVSNVCPDGRCQPVWRVVHEREGLAVGLDAHDSDNGAEGLFLHTERVRRSDPTRKQTNETCHHDIHCYRERSMSAVQKEQRRK